MPRSFLIKRVEKVKTGYFPWNKEMLVQSCCLEYEVREDMDEARCKDTLKMIAQNLMQESGDDGHRLTKHQFDEIKLETVEFKGKLFGYSTLQFADNSDFVS